MAAFPETPVTLLERLSKNDQTGPWNAAWQTFFDLYLAAIRISVVRAYMRYGWHSVPDHLVSDTVSDIAVSLIRGQEKFTYDPARGRFRGYIGQVVHWKVKDRLKAMRPEPHESDASLVDKIGADHGAYEKLALEEEQAWRYSTLYLLLEEASKRVSPQTFAIFELSKIKNQPTDSIMRDLGISRSTLDNANHRMMKVLAQLAGKPEYRRELLP